MFSEDFYGIYLVVEAVVAFFVLAIAAHWSQGLEGARRHGSILCRLQPHLLGFISANYPLNP